MMTAQPDSDAAAGMSAGADEDPVYAHYWKRKQLLAEGAPTFPLRRWWRADGLCEIEDCYFQAVRGASSLLDVGAGDLRVMRKFRAAGYSGEYHTQDVGHEASYTYSDLREVQREYGAILCLDVLEHLTLDDGLALLRHMTRLVCPGGVLVLQTPNARCIRNPMSWDMTHRHCYNAPDLWAFLTVLGMRVEGYRVRLTALYGGLVAAIKFWLGAFVTARLLGADYADNIALIAWKSPLAERRPDPPS